MINGFLIQINNNSSNEQLVHLFKQAGLPEGVTVSISNTDHHYNSLLLEANTKGFMGSGIMTDNESALQLTIHNDADTENIVLHKLLADKKIIIDSFSKYISITVPPLTNMTLQLLPI